MEKRSFVAGQDKNSWTHSFADDGWVPLGRHPERVPATLLEKTLSAPPAVRSAFKRAFFVVHSGL